MRRFSAFCGLAAMVLVLLVALGTRNLATVSARTPGNLVLAGVPLVQGCPLGPAFTFCNQSAGVLPPAPFTIKALSDLSGVSVSLGAVPGLSGNFAPGDFTMASNSCTGGLAAGASCTLAINFTPTMPGLRAATVAVTDSAGDKLAFNIEGTNSTLSFLPPPPIVCSPPVPPGTAFAFCTAALGTTSTAETFTLASTAAVSGLNLSLAAIPGLTSEFDVSQPDFAIESTTCGAALGASSSCNVSVAFTPKTAGLRAAALTATDSQDDRIVAYVAGSTTAGLVVLLSNSGNFMSCLPSTGFQFCNEPSGGTTGTIAYTVENSSGTQVTGLTITPPVPTTPPTQPPPTPSNFTVLSTTCTPTLAAGASCTLNVAFTPQATGLLQGPVEVSDAQGDLAAVNLAGVGDDYTLSLANSQPTEMTIEQGQLATFKAQAAADSVFGANGEMVMFACPNAMPVFSTCAFAPCPVNMMANAATTFNVLIATSSKTITAPPVSNPCQATAASSNLTRQPVGVLYLAPKTAGQGEASGLRATTGRVLFLALLSAGAMSMMALGSIARRRKRLLLAFTALVFVGCHHSSATTAETPTGVYPLTITGNALDANGNALNAARSLSFTLNVITGK